MLIAQLLSCAGRDALGRAMFLSRKWSAGLGLALVLWFFAAIEGRALDASPGTATNPALWGIYAEIADRTWTGEHGSVSWAWAADGTLVQSDAGWTSVIRLGAQPGQLVQESGALYTYDGYVAADGSVLWLRRGPFKTPMRLSLKDGRVVAESVKIDDARQVVDVTRARTYGPVARAASAPAPAAPAAAPSAPAAPAGTQVVATVSPTPMPSTSPPPAPKSAPRTLSQADLARLRERMQGDRARRAQALTQERAAAEQLRQQMEQIQQMATFEEEAWDEEPAAPAPNLAEVFLTTLGNEMAKNQAEREAQDAFIRDLQRQQAAAAERRQREEQRRRADAERARQPQYAQAPTPAARAMPDAAEQARQAQAAARYRELAAQAAAERQRLQQVRAQQQTAAPTTTSSGSAAGNASATAAVKPLRFILTIGLLNKPGDAVNPTCYSNVITRPGPPGWGAPGFLPPGSGEQARAAVYALKDAFISRCRASGREITSDGNFNYVWNQTSGDEQTLQGVRARFREDVSVSL